MTSLEKNWWWCTQCRGLWYNAEMGKYGVCPAKAGGHSSHKDSGAYSVHRSSGTPNMPADYKPQANWRRCSKCMCLTFTGLNVPCAAGGNHDYESHQYALAMCGGSPSGHQPGWTWCKKCACLFYGASQSSSACPSGGTHDGSASGPYSLVFVDDRKSREAKEIEWERDREDRPRREREEREREERERKEREERERREREAEILRREVAERLRIDEERHHHHHNDEDEKKALEVLTRKFEELQKENANLRAALHEEKVARITAEIKLERMPKY